MSAVLVSPVMGGGSYAGNSASGGFVPHAVGPRADRADAAGAGVRSRLRLTRRGRVVLTILGAVPVALLAISLVLGSGGAAADVDGPSNVGLSFVTVVDGQSLWDIAESLAPRSDPRDVIDEIMRLNGLDDSVVQPGQELALPAVR